MRYSQVLYFVKASLITGGAFFGVAVVCFVVLTVLLILYGDIKSYEMDPENPDIMRGDKHDMDRATFDRYYLISKTIAGICFLNILTGMIMYLLWRKQGTCRKTRLLRRAYGKCQLNMLRETPLSGCAVWQLLFLRK
jgi:hypothetical protein